MKRCGKRQEEENLESFLPSDCFPRNPSALHVVTLNYNACGDGGSDSNDRVQWQGKESMAEKLAWMAGVGGYDTSRFNEAAMLNNNLFMLSTQDTDS